MLAIALQEVDAPPLFLLGEMHVDFAHQRGVAYTLEKRAMMLTNPPERFFHTPPIGIYRLRVAAALGT